MCILLSHIVSLDQWTCGLRTEIEQSEDFNYGKWEVQWLKNYFLCDTNCLISVNLEYSATLPTCFSSIVSKNNLPSFLYSYKSHQRFETNHVFVYLGPNRICKGVRHRQRWWAVIWSRCCMLETHWNWNTNLLCFLIKLHDFVGLIILFVLIFSLEIGAVQKTFGTAPRMLRPEDAYGAMPSV